MTNPLFLNCRHDVTQVLSFKANAHLKTTHNTTDTVDSVESKTRACQKTFSSFSKSSITFYVLLLKFNLNLQQPCLCFNFFNIFVSSWKSGSNHCFRDHKCSPSIYQVFLVNIEYINILGNQHGGWRVSSVACQAAAPGSNPANSDGI